jgi:hypothetical protein
MRRAGPGLLLSLLLVACSAPTKEDEVTLQVLVNAHVARDAVSHLTTRYGEIHDRAASDPGTPAGGPEDFAGFRDSAEGLAVKGYLSEFSKPVPMEPSFKRSREIGELSVATVELVNLALEPRGTWEAFAQEIGGARSRLDRALSALETGAKSHILIQSRTKTEEKAMAFSRMLAQVNAGASAPGRDEATKTP